MPRRSLRDGSPPEALYTAPRKGSIWNKLSIGNWLNKDNDPLSAEPAPLQQVHSAPAAWPSPPGAAGEPQPGVLSREASWKVIPGEPRPIVPMRQDSECRDNLVPHDLLDYDRLPVPARKRRAASTGREATHLLPARLPLDRQSAPDADSALRTVSFAPDSAYDASSRGVSTTARIQDFVENTSAYEQPAQPLPPPLDDDLWSQSETASEDPEEVALQAELLAKWILNLSMRFKDNSDREKFFITYAEQPNKWRRVTVSCDYRNAPEDSLEADLSGMRYQREKNARIYESIRKSLPAIQFYDTVTHLKLETLEGRLHVHVTEDVNEIIRYPSLAAVGHLRSPEFRIYKESEICFDSHLSGFVYKVTIGEEIFIKKEIPSPDTVEEFLYEINSLYRLRNCPDVIHFGGIIVDDDGKVIKGLLIAYAEAGALVDMIYDEREYLPWPRRKKWARQIIRGLADIHEYGFVQGDFTLSNIVIDSKDNAKIIDINRRGCPLGWEPPEFDGLIKSGQRISMYIGVKSDMFQLGMVLWGLGMEDDEPEHHPKDELELDHFPGDVPEYFKAMVLECLQKDPNDRTTAARLLAAHPELLEEELHANGYMKPVVLHESIPVIDVDPTTTVTLADIEASKLHPHTEPDKSNTRNSPSTRYQYDSEYVTGHNRSSGFGGAASSASSPVSDQSKAYAVRGSEPSRPSQDPNTDPYDRSQITNSPPMHHSFYLPEITDLHPSGALPSHNALQEALSTPTPNAFPLEPFYPLTTHLSAEPTPLPQTDHLFPIPFNDPAHLDYDPSSLSSAAPAVAPPQAQNAPYHPFPPPLHHDSGFDESPFDTPPSAPAVRATPKSPPTPTALAAPVSASASASASAPEHLPHDASATGSSDSTAGPAAPPPPLPINQQRQPAEGPAKADIGALEPLAPVFSGERARRPGADEAGAQAEAADNAEAEAGDVPVELRGLGAGFGAPSRWAVREEG